MRPNRSLSRRGKLPSFLPPTPARSANMRAIRSRGNRATEQRLRDLLLRNEIRGWRRRSVKTIGSPDFIFFEEKIAIFVDGCFWHGCPRCGHIPKTNTAYWKAKIQRNQKRDRSVRHLANLLGYRVIRIWECSLKVRPQSCMSRIRSALGARRLVSTSDSAPA